MTRSQLVAGILEAAVILNVCLCVNSNSFCINNKSTDELYDYYDYIWSEVHHQEELDYEYNLYYADDTQNESLEEMLEAALNE
jgi:hypothetical protein